MHPPAINPERRAIPSLRNGDDAPVVQGPASSVFKTLSQRNVALAIWNRAIPRAFGRWLDALPARQLPSGRFVATPAETPERLSALCDLTALQDGPFRKRLIADVSSLAAIFARICGAPRLDIRLEALDHDSCWRFHRDHVGLRLNATYRGPGTQWLSPGDARRALRSQRRYRGDLNEFPRFAAGLFKGVLRSGDDAIVHRSPPIAASGTTRLFLCLNEEGDDE